MDRARRSALVISTASVLCLFTALSGVASAGGPKGIKGDPQPEMKPFNIGAASTAGNAAIESNGSIVVVYDIAPNDVDKTFVCVLDRGGRKCSHTVTLTPSDVTPSDDDTEGVPQVFTPSPNHVVVLQETCCDSSPNGDDFLYTSVNGGKTFGAPVRVGSFDITTAALVGDQIAFSTGDDSTGAQVQSVPVTHSGPPATIATATAKEAFDVSMGSYKGGVLIASDSGNATYNTYVAYAKSGDNFNASSSYHNVGVFNHERLVWSSGDALLTIQTGGKESMELRLFNGTRFGAAHVVPGTSGGGPYWATVDQDPSGRVHVFSSTIHSAVDYDLTEESTSNGVKWSGPVNLGNAIDSDNFAAALDSHGSGIVLGTEPGIGYPVLATQGISFTLKSSRIRKGRQTTGSGKGSPAASGRLVQLQVERSGRWFTVGTTHEGTGGSFSFKIKGNALGTHDYRAVVSDLAGYLQYGYSPARALRVTS